MIFASMIVRYKDNYRVFVIPNELLFSRVTFLRIWTFNIIVKFWTAVRTHFLLPAPLEIQIHAGDNMLPLLPFVSSLINSATEWLPCFSRLGIKSRVLLPSGLLCAARTRAPSRSGRQSVRERTYRRAYERRFMRAIVRPAEGRRTAVNVAPFTFP